MQVEVDFSAGRESTCNKTRIYRNNHNAEYYPQNTEKPCKK